MQIQKYTLENVKEMLIKKIKEVDKDLEIKDDGGILKVTKGKDKFSVGVGLSNILQQLNSGDDPDKTLDTRMLLIKDFLNKEEVMKNMGDWSFVKDKIIFVPTPKEHCESIGRRVFGNKPIKKENLVYSKGFIQDIVLAGAVDFPGYFAYIIGDMIEKWGKTKDEIDEQIGKNLQKFETEYEVHNENGRLIILGMGGILSTFLLKPKKLREIADKNGFKGKELVGIIPFRDIIIMEAHTMNNAMELWNTGFRMIHDNIRPYPVSPKPFMVDTDGVISQFKSDEFPAEGVAVAVNPKTRRIETLALGRKESNINLPSPESMEEAITKDPKLMDALSVMAGAAEGIPAEEFAKAVLKWTKDKELSKRMIDLMIKGEWIKMKDIDDELRIFPTPKTLKLILNKGR